ncbi:unnamed protein product [Trichogramma brassicae]|uniref:Uncharacterized protein n=1 Tax=Trichogramma brassicae TaxID=86971 RepID=A0A6H5J718_9HYME|nr:unnamed protein product [Trichogramma brassicae]
MASSTKNVEANECLEVLTNFIDKEILQNQVQLNDIIWPEQNLNGQNDNYESFANSTDSGFEPKARRSLKISKLKESTIYKDLGGSSGMTPLLLVPRAPTPPPPNDIEDFVSAPTSSQSQRED